MLLKGEEKNIILLLMVDIPQKCFTCAINTIYSVIPDPIATNATAKTTVLCAAPRKPASTIRKLNCWKSSGSI